ncbi:MULTISPECIES: hypothetical protein [Streptococcus]|uniref:hypothetical protein n=1 Tax=Streptococcus sp. UMB0029 TaxID=2069308 RepID=UPI000C802FEE|nr:MULTISPECIES: hypothetical protein [Streptococcus]MDK7322500.1 hypothetical protein [Streptococcus mitis]PMB99804.1 hypothetical protein CJ239_10505 [Streptococcus sp. UMB0029]
MTNLKLKRLSDFMDDMIQKYQIEETKDIQKKLRIKFVRELEAMGEWEKANSKTFGRNRTKVFNYEILDRLEKRCERYLVKKSGFDFDKFKDYKSNIDSENYFEEPTEDELKDMYEKAVFRSWAGSISKEEIRDVMLTALFEKFFTPIDVEQWQKDSDILTIVGVNDDRESSFEYYRAKERYSSHNKSAYYKERK